MLPGSHRLITPVRYTPYFSYAYEPFFNQIKEYSKPVIAQAGEAVIYNSRLIHYSPPNLSGKTREAVGMVTVPAEAKPIHLFRPDVESEEIEVFEVNESFFHDFKIGERPRSTMSSKISLDTACFTLEDLKKQYGPKRGVLTRLRNALSLSKEKWTVGLFDKKKKGDYDPKDVAGYYDSWTDKYLQVYGDVIQAYRPADVKELLDHTIESALLENGQSILDAGCGVAGPAIHFATSLDVSIEAVTVSEVQVAVGKQKLMEAALKGHINLQEGYYHNLKSIYPDQQFDRILFLESLGHAEDPGKVINQAHAVTVDRGYIYIKDFFVREVANEAFKKRIDRVIGNMNRYYTYNVLDLHDTLTALRMAGYHLDMIKRPEYASDINIRKNFEEQFGIDVFEGEEIMPAEWLEIRCQKLPW